MTSTVDDSQPWVPGHRAKMVCDAVIVAVAAGYALLAERLGLGGLAGPGPGFFPLLVGVLLGLAASIHLVTLTVRQRREQLDIGVGRPSVRAGLVLIALVAYLMAVPLLGHLLSATVMTAAVLKLLGPRSIGVILAVAAATGFLSDLVFTALLGVALPAGSLGVGWSSWI